MPTYNITCLHPQLNEDDANFQIEAEYVLYERDCIVLSNINSGHRPIAVFPAQHTLIEKVEEVEKHETQMEKQIKG